MAPSDWPRAMRRWLQNRDWRQLAQHGLLYVALFLGFGLGRLTQPVPVTKGANSVVQPALPTKDEHELAFQRRNTVATERSFIASTASAVAAGVGTILLVWTLLVTRSTARRQLRAYVSVEPRVLATIGQPDGKYKMEVSIQMKNGGATPAYRCVHGGNIVILSLEKRGPFFLQEEHPAMGEPAPFVIHSQQISEGVISGTEVFSHDDFEEVRSGDKSLFVFGMAEYDDTFGKRRRTEFCYMVEGKRFQIGRQSGSATPGQPGRFDWTLAPYHNDAT